MPTGKRDAGQFLLRHGRKLSAAQEASLAVIGFDDQPIARAMQITSVDIPLYSIGQFLFEQAISEKISHKEVSTELMERSTV